jgi:hypothetical protein
MKSQDFGMLLNSFADVVAAAGNPNAKEQILQLANIFSVAPDTVSKIVKRINTQPHTTQVSTSWKLGEIVPLISSLRDLLAKAAKTDVLADIARVEDMLVSLSAIDIEELRELANQAVGDSPADAQGIRDNLVGEYFEKLKENYKDEKVCSDIFREAKSRGGPVFRNRMAA